jgi:DNA-binding PadR family transcriptional regulator
MFQLKESEAENLRSQIATSSWGGRRNRPYAFTEQGVAMLSAVLASERAVKMSVLIIRAFVRMRELIANHKELAARVEKIEDLQNRQNAVITILADEISDLKAIPTPGPKRRIGSHGRDDALLHLRKRCKKPVMLLNWLRSPNACGAR